MLRGLPQYRFAVSATAQAASAGAATIFGVACVRTTAMTAAASKRAGKLFATAAVPTIATVPCRLLSVSAAPLRGKHAVPLHSSLTPAAAACMPALPSLPAALPSVLPQLRLQAGGLGCSSIALRLSRPLYDKPSSEAPALPSALVPTPVVAAAPAASPKTALAVAETEFVRYELSQSVSAKNQAKIDAAERRENVIIFVVLCVVVVVVVAAIAAFVTGLAVVAAAACAFVAAVGAGCVVFAVVRHILRSAWRRWIPAALVLILLAPTAIALARQAQIVNSQLANSDYTYHRLTRDDYEAAGKDYGYIARVSGLFYSILHELVLMPASVSEAKRGKAAVPADTSAEVAVAATTAEADAETSVEESAAVMQMEASEVDIAMAEDTACENVV